MFNGVMKWKNIFQSRKRFLWGICLIFLWQIIYIYTRIGLTKKDEESRLIVHPNVFQSKGMWKVLIISGLLYVSNITGFSR